MKHNNLRHTFSELKNIELETPIHQMRLRNAILNMEQPSQVNVTSVPWRLSKGVCMKKIISIVGVGIMVPVVAFVWGFSPLNPQVYARNMTNDSIAQYSKLSDREKEDIKQKLAVDPGPLLSDALSAKDLNRLSRDDVNRLAASKKLKSRVGTVTTKNGAFYYGEITGGSTSIPVQPQSMSVGQPVDTQGETVADPGVNSHSTAVNAGAETPEAASTDNITGALEKQKNESKEFVSFTNSKGELVVVGFDTNNRPIFTATFV